MTRAELGRLAVTLGIAAAAGWVVAAVWIIDKATKPTPLRPPRRLLDGTIAGDR